MLVDRLYTALNRHEVATAQGEAIQLRWENEMKQAADKLQATLNARSDDDSECVAIRVLAASSKDRRDRGRVVAPSIARTSESHQTQCQRAFCILLEIHNLFPSRLVSC